MKELIKDLKMVITSNVEESYKDETCQKLIDYYVNEQLALNLPLVSRSNRKNTNLNFQDWLFIKLKGLKKVEITNNEVKFSLSNLYDLYKKEIEANGN